MLANVRLISCTSALVLASLISCSTMTGWGLRSSMVSPAASRLTAISATAATIGPDGYAERESFGRTAQKVLDPARMLHRRAGCGLLGGRVIDDVFALARLGVVAIAGHRQALALESSQVASELTFQPFLRADSLMGAGALPSR